MELNKKFPSVREARNTTETNYKTIVVIIPDRVLFVDLSYPRYVCYLNLP